MKKIRKQTYFHRAFRPIFASLLVLMWVVSDVAGQTEAKRIAQELQAVEKILFQDPAVASVRLQQLIAGYPQAADSIKSLLYLKLSTSLGMTGKMDSAVWAVREALRFSPDDHIQEAEALRVLAILYRLQGKFDQAEDAILKSLRLHNSLPKNSVKKSITLQEYGSLALDQLNYAKAIALFVEALEILQDTALQDAHKQITIPKLRINLAEAYMNSGNYDLAIREFELARPILDSLGDREGYVRTGERLATMYVSAGKYGQADTLLNKIYPLAEKLQNEEMQAYITLGKANLQAAQRRYAQALLFYRKAYAMLTESRSAYILECVNPYLKALAHTGGETEARQVTSAALVTTALKSAQPATTLQYRRNAIKFLWRDLTPSGVQSYYEDLLQLSDSVHTDEKRKADLEARTKYQLDRQKEFEAMLQTENTLLKERAGYKRSQLVLSIALGLLTCLILPLIVLRLRQRARSQADQLGAQLQEIQFHKDRTVWAEREKTLREQIIQQQKALLAERIADAEHLQAQLEQLVQEQQQSRREEILAQYEKAKQEQAGIEILMSQFNTVYPGFASALRRQYSKLSLADVQLCTLIRMNLTTKEISLLLHIEPRSVYVKKYRIMEKMGLAEGDDFEQLIFSLDHDEPA